MIDQAAFDVQMLTDLAVAESAILFGQPDHCQTLIVIILIACLMAEGAEGNPKNIAWPL